MTLPANGVPLKDAHHAYINPLAIFKGISVHLIVRDYLRAMTNLKDPAMGLCTDGVFTPFAADGLWRDDLYDPDFPGGQWYSTGLIKDSGSKFKSDFDVEKVMTAQLIRAARWDETSQDNELGFVAEELNEVVAALRNNLPLATNVRDIGQSGRAWLAPSEPTRAEYQAAVLADDGDKRIALVIPRMSRKSIGDLDFQRKNSAESELKYGVEHCPFTDVPFYLVPEGAGYRALGGAPVFSGPPVATPGSTGAAAVVFTVPTLPKDPAPDVFTYTWEQKVGAGAWTAVSPASTSAAGVTVTANFTALTAGSTQFRVTAAADSGLSTTSNPSVAVTIT